MSEPAASMRAAVAVRAGAVELRSVPEPPAPGPGEVLLACEAVGLCGSDLHYLGGEFDDARFPRVLGHELAGTVSAVGPGVKLHRGDRVAVWPLLACGDCYACRIGRPNVCPNFTLIGIHSDGGLQERLLVPASQCVPIDVEPGLATLAEPISIAVHAANRGRVVAGERAVVVGAGPIGLALCLVLLERGADVLLIDRLAARLELGAALGAETLRADGPIDPARVWAGGDGPPVVFEATGAAPVIEIALGLASPAGRIVIVGLPTAPATLSLGVIPHRELDVLGASCCTREEFVAAVALVVAHGARLSPLISGRFPLARAADAFAQAATSPAETMKLIVSPAA